MTDVDLAIHRAGPAQDEPPYRRYCLRCNVFYPCPTVQEQARAEAAEIVADRRRHGEANRIGVLALVERGVTVWSSDRRDARGEAKGGVVVEINDVVDPPTGEVIRWLTCLDPYGAVKVKGGANKVKVHKLRESEVLPSGVEATANSRRTTLIRRLAKEVAEATGSYLDPFQADRIRWMAVLAADANLTT